VSTPILATKLFTPAPRARVVLRHNLIERLNDSSRSRRVTLISAPAGFGKTTLASEWAAGSKRPVAWLSLDDGDNDPAHFLMYLVAAVRTVASNIGDGVLGALQSPQLPPVEPLLTALLNEITTAAENFVLVLDDYHVIDAKPVDDEITFLLEHLPSQMHLVIITREDPQLPLARLRASGQLTELRINDLRFTLSESAEFLNQVMGLELSSQNIEALETRTEGWIAGLQLAGISMQGLQDATSFIESFTGSHHFVMDYLVEEVLQQQPEDIQAFLLRTSILDRLCGPLCDAILLSTPGYGQETLEHLERSNLFIIPLDNERRWYRYHHLFADLLRQRLQQRDASQKHKVSQISARNEDHISELHVRASAWYEANGLELEAFHHATYANDFERAERLIEGNGMPLHFRGAVAPVLNWLESLPTTVLDAWPSLWTAFASTLSVTGQTTRVEPALRAAETALENAEQNQKTRDLIGRVAAIRATVATAHHDVETIINESRRALEYLHTDNLAFRTSTAWKLGFAYQLQGNRLAAGQAYNEVIAIGRASGNNVFTLLATIGLGILHEGDNDLLNAAETYRVVLRTLGDKPLPFASEAHLGLARIFYEWNDLESSELHAQQSLELARKVESNDRFIACEVFLARLRLAQKDVAGASAILAKAEQAVRRLNFGSRMPEVTAAEVLILLGKSNLTEAAELVKTQELPLSRARVCLAQGDSSAALSALEPLRVESEAKGWKDEQLKISVLRAIALRAEGEKNNALKVLNEALTLAEPGGFIRIFVDEGVPMARLLSEASRQGLETAYIGKLLDVLRTEQQNTGDKSKLDSVPSLIEPLSQRELEVLKLIAEGLSNREISERLFVALITVKGHNQRIFGKLQVQRRTEAVARARELGLL
jgi:LuxR family transcriptional regulator, maltose regulon positive regulatory protein